MHQNFFSDTSSDCVGFSKESEAQMKLIVYGATKDIVLLRTCPTLFQAYDHVSVLIFFYSKMQYFSNKSMIISFIITTAGDGHFGAKATFPILS